ncbi:uncharacterized protein LOC123396836 [Hordeum vulgare subsp. vulgare]|uniref:Dirigent protein n=1 Tax=Hordeum vulgare subsp. vulgare TaxID=112509 RepID=A0A8I6XSG9_HORVV|nr:uncharacterized protein LOC123396836 [Hordeum vulgare subsp. vulgare]
MEKPSICQITPRSAVVESTEFNFTNLYLRRNFSGKDRNQLVIQEGGFGETAVNNWSLYDGDGPDATIVARVQGLHSQAGDWQSTFTIVFQNEWFKGSTFEVIGVPTDGGEWAIVGGTGQFAMATGVISKSVHEQRGDGNTIELTMHGFYLSRSLLTKSEPLGSNYGVAEEIAQVPK